MRMKAWADVEVGKQIEGAASRAGVESLAPSRSMSMADVMIDQKMRAQTLVPGGAAGPQHHVHSEAEESLKISETMRQELEK